MNRIVKKELKKYLINDDDFLKIYNNSKRKIEFKNYLNSINYLINDIDFNFNLYLLDKKYIDLTWLYVFDSNQQKEFILNVDEIYFEYKSIMNI